MGEFHMYHGAVLSQLMRAEHPYSIKLIEKDAQAMTWAAYAINDLRLLVKHSTLARKAKHNGDQLKWQFTFQPIQLGALAANEHWVALVCADAGEKGTSLKCTALLDPQQVGQVLDLQDATRAQSVSVMSKPGHSLRVTSGRLPKDLVIARGRLGAVDFGR